MFLSERDLAPAAEGHGVRSQVSGDAVASPVLREDVHGHAHQPRSRPRAQRTGFSASLPDGAAGGCRSTMERRPRTRRRRRKRLAATSEPRKSRKRRQRLPLGVAAVASGRHRWRGLPRLALQPRLSGAAARIGASATSRSRQGLDSPPVARAFSIPREASLRRSRRPRYGRNTVPSHTTRSCVRCSGFRGGSAGTAAREHMDATHADGVTGSGPPPGYVPTEPGMVPSPAGAKAPPEPAAANSGPPTAAPGPNPDLTASIVAGMRPTPEAPAFGIAGATPPVQGPQFPPEPPMPVPQHAASSASAVPAPRPEPERPTPKPAATSTQDPVATAQALQAAPMSPPAADRCAAARHAARGCSFATSGLKWTSCGPMSPSPTPTTLHGSRTFSARLTLAEARKRGRERPRRHLPRRSRAPSITAVATAPGPVPRPAITLARTTVAAGDVDGATPVSGAGGIAGPCHAGRGRSWRR